MHRQLAKSAQSRSLLELKCKSTNPAEPLDSPQWIVYPVMYLLTNSKYFHTTADTMGVVGSIGLGYKMAQAT